MAERFTSNRVKNWTGVVHYAKARPEKVVAVFDLPGASIKVGWGHRAPLFLVVHDTGRVTVTYPVADVFIELRSTS